MFMQNYEQILQELGIEIPEEKKADLKKKMGENYRTKTDYDKAVEKRDEYKRNLDDVQAKLDGFKDVDVADLKNQVSTLTTQLANEKAAREADARKVELDKDVTALFSALDENGEKKYEFLIDFNEELCRMICELIGLHPNMERTEAYKTDFTSDETDFRERIHPKKDFHIEDPEFVAKPYYQVFEQKLGFIPNLSIIDLLFNMGPESLLLL